MAWSSLMKKSWDCCVEPLINDTLRRVSIKVRGIVQGVGFRPFIYRLARTHGLRGWVLNDSDGVEMEVAGFDESVRCFIERISLEAPPLARVVSCHVRQMPWVSLGEFSILHSRGHSRKGTLISPDVCTCLHCLRELFDPLDRRFRYPFINCTHCGPRYTIIRDIPYDRAFTTMAAFSMCSRCTEEYKNPLDRRFHAQPNACPVCGPRVWMEDRRGERAAEGDSAVRQAVSALADGAIVAVKGLGGFHLAVSATDEGAVARLRRRKVREEKPFAVMFAHLDAVRMRCEVSDTEEELLTGPARPIVVLDRKHSPEGVPPAPSVAPGNRNLGAFLPYTPLHFLLFDPAPYDSLVLTSGNRSDEPIVTDNGEARERLGSIADYFLLHDRDIHLRCDDSVIGVHGREHRPIRRARGYVPVPIPLGREVPCVLGVGAELKNTVCLTRGAEAFVSHHLGDLENIEVLRAFEGTIAHFERILEVEPRCVVHDLHPDYLSTRWAIDQKGAPCLAVQHHHAHIASVAAEHGFEEPLLGVALDGTGYGTDGTIWGGELLRVDGHTFERLGHFRQIPMPGGQAAVREPWRMALSYLHALEGEGAERVVGELMGHRPEKSRNILLQMLEKGINSPLTSSCGRLFDAVAALAGLRETITYEGQAAILLEQAMDADDGMYRGEVCREGSLWVLDPLPMIAETVNDVRRGVKPGSISARFHRGLVAILARWVAGAAEASSLRTVALSGGVFQNRVILEGLSHALVEYGLVVLRHREVPPNDGCISLGQAHVGTLWLQSPSRGA